MGISSWFSGVTSLEKRSLLPPEIAVNKVHQFLNNYQGFNTMGESWLRYMVFQPAANKISIYTYNSALDTKTILPVGST